MDIDLLSRRPTSWRSFILQGAVAGLFVIIIASSYLMNFVNEENGVKEDPEFDQD